MIGTGKPKGCSSRRVARSTLAIWIVAGVVGCSDKAPPQQNAHPVLVTTVRNLPGGHERIFTGVVRARHESDHGFRTAGKVVTRLVEVGETVKAGQPLARLDPADYELAVRAAEDQLQATRVDAEQAASDEARFRRLLADHSVSVADHERQKARSDAAAARRDQASRQLELARNRTRYATLVAEFAGLVTAVRFEIGQVVAEGQPVITIARPSELEVVADLPEEMARDTHTLTASATFWNVPDLAVGLKLRELAPAAAAQTRTFRARFSITDKSPAAHQALHLGMTANLHLASTDGEPAAVVPATALLKTNGKTTVWQMDDSGKRLTAKPVEVIRYTDESALVRGLSDGARVVSAGIQKLDPGLDVTPVERSASGMNLAMPPASSDKASVPEGRS
jgi:RND family efflux transporter MFP subunit